VVFEERKEKFLREYFDEIFTRILLKDIE